MTRIATTVGAVLAPGVAAAHAEHFAGGHFGIVHFLTDPLHMGLTFAAVLLFIVASRTVRRPHAKSRRKP